MRKIPEEEFRLLAIAAARLRNDAKNQKQIAAALAVSQTVVYRLLTFARKHHYLTSREAVLPENIEAEDWNKVEQRYFVDPAFVGALSERVPHGLHLDARIFSGSYDEFTFAAAGRIIDLIQRAKHIGVMWGRTIEKLIAGIKARRKPRRGTIECLPLCGEPVYSMTQELLEFSASQLAVNLARSIQASHRGLPCLTGVPAYVGRKVLAPESDQPSPWEEFVHGIPNYERIFGTITSDRLALVNSLDAVLTGVGIVVTQHGSKDYETGVFIRERVAQEGIAKEALNRIILGDIGGLLIEKPGLNPRDHQLVKDLNAGWTGIKASHLERVAKSARPGRAPGVIVAAYGEAKAELVNEIIKRGYVNELVIDPSLADALKGL